MDLQNFVTEVIETMGGAVVPLEYALCHVLIPDSFSEIFHGKSEVTLAFDFEVAQENPESEFITFGSNTLDNIIDIVDKNAISTIRFGVIDRLSLSNPEEKISKFLNARNRNDIKITAERPIMGIWAVFSFRISYTSDMQVNEIQDIWVDLLTGKVSPNMKKNEVSVFYEMNSLYNYPIPVLIDIHAAFSTAYRHVVSESEKNKESKMRRQEFQNEIDRIRVYYTDLENENLKRMLRKGTTDEKKQELISKGAALELEKEKQQLELEDKYRIKVDISLCNGIIYAIPQLEYHVLVSFRNLEDEKVIYYNPVLKELCNGCENFM